MSDREKRELRMLRRRVRAGGSEGDGACDRDEVHHVRARMQAGRECPQAPNAAEVVDPDRALDDLGLDVEEAPPRRDAGVVDEEVDGRVALEDACGDLVHLRAIADIAGLPLAADLSCYPLELSARRASSTQCHPPLRASARAIAAPIPVEAPVTTATRWPAIARDASD